MLRTYEKETTSFTEDEKIKIVESIKRLEKVYREAKIIHFCENSKYVFMSDCHRGTGNWGDNYLLNQHLNFAALNYYYRTGFTYFELGDGEELWENRCLEDIIQVHSNVYWLLSKFNQENRLYMIYGNHDMVKKNLKYRRKNYESYFCENDKQHHTLFPDIEVVEGIRLKKCFDKQEIFLAHGHQGDFINDYAWKLGRFLVRHLWKPLEQIGIKDPTRAAKNYRKKNKVDRRFLHFAKVKDLMVIAGHTHRPRIPQDGEPLYFNTGSQVHPRCITCLELQNGKMSLVKWSVMTREDRSLFVGREVLESRMI